jgi:hypothetical protein
MTIARAESPHTAIDGADLTIANSWWKVVIRTGTDPGPSQVMDLRNGLIVADQPYCYKLETRTGALRHSCRGLVEVVPRMDGGAGGAQTVILEGRLDFGKDGPTDIFLRHRITLPADAPWLEEQITLHHRFGRHTHELHGLRFGLRKLLFDR